MPTVIIPISRFTRRVMTSRYGAEEPYKIRRSDDTYYHLTAEPIRGNTCFTKLNQLLTDRVQLRVSAILSRRLRAKKRQHFIGLHLHKVFQAKMLTFVEAQVLAGVPAQSALKNFLSHNGVTEDDYSLETAYTAWKRHKQVFFEKNIESSAPFWPGSGPEKTPKRCASELSLPVPVDIVVRAAQNYFNCGYVNLLCKPVTIERHNQPFTYPVDPSQARAHAYERKVLAWLLYFHCQITTDQVAGIIGRHVSRIRRYIQEISFQRTTYEKVRADIQAIEASIEHARTNLQAG